MKNRELDISYNKGLPNKRKWLMYAPAFVLFFLFLGLAYIVLKEKQPAVPLEISIGTSRSSTATLLMIADEKGCFTDVGLNVTLRYYDTADKGFQDMLEGNIDIAGIAETPIARESFKHHDFQIFSVIGSFTNDPKILARVESGITSPADLLGKRIGTTKPGQSAHFFLYLYLLEHGISLNDITLVHESPSQLISQLNKGELDAVCLFEPLISRGKTEMGEKGVVLSSPGLYQKFYSLVAKRNFIEKNRHSIKKIINALIQAEYLLATAPEEANSIFAGTNESQKSIAEKILQDDVFYVSLSEEHIMTLKEEANWLKKTGLVNTEELPYYRDLFHIDSLMEISPERIGIQK